MQHLVHSADPAAAASLVRASPVGASLVRASLDEASLVGASPAGGVPSCHSSLGSSPCSAAYPLPVCFGVFPSLNGIMAAEKKSENVANSGHCGTDGPTLCH